MPKEQGHSGERSTHRISKNAKDKSNRSALWASQVGTHMQQSGMGDVSGRMLRCHSEKDSEKDSGYSETGSDFVHTDVDDQRSSVSEPHRQSSKTLDSKSVNGASNNITTYEELTPIYVFKNLVVKSVGFVAGSNGQPLPAQYLNALDSVLIPVIHSRGRKRGDESIVMELIFYILENIT